MSFSSGKNVSISFDGKKCIHARNCVLSLPAVFQADKEGEWIFPDEGDTEDIIVLAQGCPSGAIQYERHDGGKSEPKPKVNTVRIIENGPLAFKANLKLDDADLGARATLCRCGASKNKPFCDGSHHDVKFGATGEIAIKDVSPLDERDGELTLTPIPDGPLMVKGNLELLRVSGTKAGVATQTALCRCGASANKPYCDGNHVKIGFKSS